MRALRPFVCTFCALGVATFCARGNPLGGTVVPGSGAASISSALGTLTIDQTTPRVIINWRDFSIGAGEITRFVQPSAGAAALNRVTTANPSQIYGTLQGNGAVYLINQNGILVGPSAQINVGTFLGSTLDFGPDEQSANASFLSGAGLRLSGNSTAAIRNEGYISALDDVFLIAHSVQNAGTISGHTVGLAAGADIELRQSGTERLAVLAGNSRAQPGAADGVVNSGNIAAVTAELKAAGGNIYALAINNGGAIRATGIVKENGRILLRADRGTVVNSGTLDASSQTAGSKGGDVKVLGERVGLVGNSKIDVSGDAGGGTVLVGGDLQGKNADVPNAQRTVVGRNSTIKADALSSGDGGKVIIWSDEATRYLGEISARGAGAKGNGGFVEVSGKASLTFDGAVNVAAAGSGTRGTVLLDPRTITIQAAGPDVNGDMTIGDDLAGNLTAGDFAGVDSIITPVAVNGLLTGNNTLILGATERTTVNAAINGSGNASLRLEAPRVDLNAPITLAGSGVLSGTPTVVNVGIFGGTQGSIQNAVDVAVAGGTVTVAAGSYAENISVMKGLTLRGAQAGVSATTRDTSTGESIIRGQVHLERPNTTFDGFTVRESAAGAGIVANNAAGDQIINNYITDNVFGLSLASDGSSQIRVQNNFFENNTRAGGASGNGIYTDFTVSDVLISANKFTGNPEGSVTFLGSAGNPQSNVEISDNFIVNPLNIRNNGPIGIGNITGVTIRRNTISEAGDAIWIGGGVDGATIQNNLIQNNDGAGVKFARPSSSGIAATSRNILIRENSFSANVDGGILVDVREGTRYTDAGNGNVINASGNWWGNSALPTVSISDTPSGTINFRLNMAGDPPPPEKVDFSPWLNSGANSVAMGSPGFMGNLTVLNVSPTSPKATADGFIAEALTAPFNLTTRLQLFAGNYNDQAIINIPVAVVLKGDVTLTAGTSVSLGSTVDTDGTVWTLDVISPMLTLGGAVGNAAPGAELGRLTASGGTAINGGIVKTRIGGSGVGNQTYSGAVTLGADTVLTASTATFENTVNGTASGNESLTINGNAVFGNGAGDFVGNAVPLEFVNVSGTTALNAGNAGAATVRTTLGQDYNGAVTLGRDTSLSGSTIAFNNKVNGTANGTESLAIVGNAVFGNGAGDFVGDLFALELVDVSGTTALNGGSVNTAGTQDYDGAVTLGANTLLQNTTVSFGSTVTGGGRNLTLDSSGDVTLNGINILTVGTFATLAGGSTRISGGALNANTLISIGDQLVLLANTTLAAPAVTLAAVTGGGNDLRVNALGLTTFGGAVSGVGALSTDTGGNTRVNAPSVSANTSIVIADQLELGANTVLAAPAVTLAGVTGNTFDLALNASGVTTLNGVISGVGALTTDMLGSTRLNTASVSANTSIGIADQLDLGISAVLGAPAVTLAGVTGNGHNLTINASGVTTLNGVVGDVAELRTDLLGSTRVNTASVSANTLIDIADQLDLGVNTSLSAPAVTLAGVTGNTRDLALNASGATTLNGIVSGVGALTTDFGGTTAINRDVSAGSVNLGDAATLNGVTVTTTGDQIYEETVDLGGATDTTLTGTTIIFNKTVNALNSGLQGLRINGDAVFGDSAGDFVGNVMALEFLNVSGSATFNAGNVGNSTVRTSGDQTYGGLVTLGANTTFAGDNVTLAGVAGGGSGLRVNASGVTTFNGALSGVSDLSTDAVGSTRVNTPSVDANTSITIADQLDLGIGTTLAAPAITLAGVTGNGRDLTLNAFGVTTLNGAVAGVDDLITDAPGSTRINTASVSANTSISIADQLDLGIGTVFGAGAITLAGVTGNGRDLTLNASGVTTLNGLVNGVNNFSTDAGGSTRINIASLTANTSIDVGDQLDLGLDTTLGALAVTLAGVTGNGRDLTLNASGVTTLNGAVTGVDDLSTDAVGSTRVNATSISANRSIGIADQLDLGIGTTLAAPAITLAGVTGNGRDLTLNASGVTTVNGVVNGAGALRTDAGGNTVINQTVSAGSVTLDDTANLNGGTVTTTGDQNYNATVTLGAGTTLNGANLRLAGVTGANRDLTLNASGVTTLNGAVNGVDNLSTDGGGSTRINAPSISANTSIGIADQLDLGIGTTLAAPAITLAGVTGNGRDLMLNASGATTVNGVVNGVGALRTDAGGNTTINQSVSAASVTLDDTANLNGGTVTTTGNQDYNAAVTLGGGPATTLSGANLRLAGVTGANRDLTLNASGVTTLNGAVTGVDDLSTDAVGSTRVNATSISANTSIGIADQLDLGIETTLAAPAITLAGVTGNGRDLTLNASGVTTVNGVVNGAGALRTDAGGNTVINQTVSAGSVTLGDTANLNGGTITTSGDQNYNGAATLGANATLTGSKVSFGSAVDGASADAQSLAIVGNGQFGGAVGNSARLTSVDISGTADLNGGAVTSLGGQTYHGAVTLGGPMATTLTGGGITFDSTITGIGRQLDVTASGDVLLNGAATLLTLNIPDAGKITHNGTLTVNNLLFCGRDTVQFVDPDNVIANVDANSLLWQAGGDGFVVVDSGTARFFTGQAKGSAEATDFNESSKRLITSLVPQVQFEEIQAELGGVSTQLEEQSGILTRSTKIFFKSTEALTRSGDVGGVKKGN